MSDLRLYCIFSREALTKMNGIRGKLTAQAGHAFLHAFWDAEARHPKLAAAYRKSGSARKITLVVDTDLELQQLEAYYRDRCGVSLVVDAGYTVFDGPTMTCLGIGPIDKSDCDANLTTLRPLS